MQIEDEVLALINEGLDNGQILLQDLIELAKSNDIPLNSVILIPSKSGGRTLASNAKLVHFTGNNYGIELQEDIDPNNPKNEDTIQVYDAIGNVLAVGDTVAHITGGDGYSKLRIERGTITAFKNGKVQIDKGGLSSVQSNKLVKTV